jgi:hypothetical protein
MKSFLTNRYEAENSWLLCGYENEVTNHKQEDNMSNNPNFRNPKNGNPMQGTGGSAGGSPMEKKIRAKAEEILEKLREIYGDIGRFNKAELAEIIYYHFGNPLKAILEKPDPIRDALQQTYGPPISQRSY